MKSSSSSRPESPAALFEFGLALLDALPLKLGVLSKARRGALLLSGEPPAPVYATSPALSPHMTTEEAIGALLRNGLGHFLGNLPVLERGDPVEAVHQLRVAMRRLRSAFGLVYRFFPSAEFDALREESRRIETALGGARDWDVFVESLSEGALPSVIDAPGFETLIEAARVRAKRRTCSSDATRERPRRGAFRAVARALRRAARMARRRARRPARVAVGTGRAFRR